VHLRLFAPIDVGVDAEAKVTLKADAKVVGKGSFDVTCGSSSCSGSKSATFEFDDGDPPTVEATARVKVTPWAQGAVRAVLYGETYGAYGQVGVKASLPTDLWAYAGNGCGDANGDGKPEFVSALTLDMRARIDVTSKAVVLGDEIGSWSWNVLDRPVFFKSFGDGSALDPIFYNEPSGTSRKARMRGRMRPCWPYSDPVKYHITWSDGAVTDFTGAPTQLFAQEHQFASYGVYPIAVEAVEDTAGRKIAGSTTHNVRFMPVMDTKVVINEAFLTQ
jgi:hypothetical protein